MPAISRLPLIIFFFSCFGILTRQNSFWPNDDGDGARLCRSWRVSTAAAPLLVLISSLAFLWASLPLPTHR